MRGPLSGAWNGMFAVSRGTPFGSVTTTGTPISRMCAARSNSASALAPWELSDNALKIRAYIWPDREASWRSSARTRCVETMYQPSRTANPSPRRIVDSRRRIVLASADTIGAEIRAQHFGDDDGAVRLLVVLQQGGDRAREAEARAVQRVNELRFFPARRTVANVRASRLEVGERAAG